MRDVAVPGSGRVVVRRLRPAGQDARGLSASDEGAESRGLPQQALGVSAAAQGHVHLPLAPQRPPQFVGGEPVQHGQARRGRLGQSAQLVAPVGGGVARLQQHAGGATLQQGADLLEPAHRVAGGPRQPDAVQAAAAQQP